MCSHELIGALQYLTDLLINACFNLFNSVRRSKNFHGEGMIHWTIRDYAKTLQYAIFVNKHLHTSDINIS